MNLTASVTITVYLAGLANVSGTGSTREVVVPLASTSIVRTVPPDPPVTLEAHRADIVITGLSAADCATLGGLLVLPGGKCHLDGVAGTKITLPTGTPFPLVATSHTVPGLTGLCSGVTGIKQEYLDDPDKYAVRLTLDSGTLDTCANGKAWGSRLRLTAPNGSMKVETTAGGSTTTTTVTLATGATIHIRNHPVSRPASSGKEHFWWHYVIAKGADACKGIPTIDASGTGCPPAIGTGHSGSHPFASGPGCSNSQYP